MGDRHNAEHTPSSRTDNYQETCELKDAEIIRLARENNVNAIIHAGDFWTDSDKRLGNTFIAKVAQRWMLGGIPVIGIAGNHDLIGNNPNSFYDTTSGLLHSLGVFKIIENGEVVKFNDGNVTVALTGTNYHKHMDKPEFLNDYIVPEKKGDYHIHLVHGMLTVKSYGKLFRHTLIDQIKHTQADITFCGHDHVGFGIVNTNDKYFINPGAVVRLSASDKEMSRQVGVVLVTIDTTGIKTEFIPLKTAKPGNEVLCRQHLDDKAASEQFQEQIKDGVSKLQLGSSLSINDVLDEIYTRDGIADHIKKSITASLTNKTKSLNAVKKIAPTGTQITKIKLHNFQSHVDTEIDLTKNFNVIIGESNQGKTSLLRAIRWVAENKPSRSSVARHGTNDTYVELTLKNGTIIKRYCAGRENGYKVYHPDGTMSEGNTRMVTTVQDIMGWCNMHVGEHEELSINVLKQGESWYMIGDTVTSTDRARILGAINNTDGADATIKEIEKENGHINDAIKYEHVEIANLAAEIETAEKQKALLHRIQALIKSAILVEKIKTYLQLKANYDEATKQLDDINASFNEAELARQISHINSSIEQLKYINSRVELINSETTRIKTIDPMIEVFDQSIANVTPALTTSKSLIDVYKNINVLVKNRAVYQNDHEVATQQEASVSKIANVDLSNVREALLKHKNISEHLNCISRANWVIKSADNFIDASKCVDTFAEQRKALNDMIDKYNKIRQLRENCATLKSEALGYEQVYKDADRRYNDAVHEKINILQESHVCPLCYSVIDEQAVEQIIEKSKKE